MGRLLGLYSEKERKEQIMIGKYFLSAVIGYAIGCFSSAYFLSKTVKKSDIRRYGSGNAGMTNMLRTYGFGLALATLLLDMLKGILAYVAGYVIGGESCALLGGLFAVIGHIWPVYLKFKGGKGIATTLGMIFAINTWAGFLLLVLAIIIILVTQYVSVASFTIVILFPIICIISQPGNMFLFWVSVILLLLTLYTHRKNIYRLRTGTEGKVDLVSKIKNR